MPHRSIQIARVLGRQIGMGVTEDMQRLSLGRAVTVGLVLHLRVRDKVSVVGQHALQVLRVVLQRGVVGVAGAALEKAVMAFNHAQRIVQTGFLAGRATAVKRGQMHRTNSHQKSPTNRHRLTRMSARRPHPPRRPAPAVACSTSERWPET